MKFNITSDKSPWIEKTPPPITALPTKITVLPPRTLNHVVLRTMPEKYHAMITFYQNLLGARTTHYNAFIAFLTYDHAPHRLTILCLPDTEPRHPNSTGLGHIGFGYSSLWELVSSYQQRKALGIFPVWCVNLGMSICMYYVDPDGNEVQMQVDSFRTAEEAIVFMRSETFRLNPSGVSFLAEELVARLESGESEESIKRKVC